MYRSFSYDIENQLLNTYLPKKVIVPYIRIYSLRTFICSDIKLKFICRRVELFLI